MNELKVLGTERIAGFKFTGIEGGFGEDKKSMLVKDIAMIHGSTVKRINELINRNQNRFKKEVDIIDFLGRSERLRDFAEKHGFITSNRTEHVYLLSERGYFKLLKILEDDTAWDIYDQLVDGYFNMRQALDTSRLSPELQMFKGLFDSMAKQELETKRIDHKLDNISEIVGTSTIDWRQGTTRLIQRIAQYQGGGEAYKNVRNGIYAEIDKRAGVSLKTRLTNKRRRMADEGISKSKRDKLNKVDVIQDDKKLIEIYMAIVKEYAIKNNVWEKDY
ncbi:ORF6N domain-containing protein [Pediococcus sp. EKM202D]|uniref:ORF6N domain-containing protein n=1 Tax=unclassified Pediococcus TaxID=554805 RepID=UPI00142E530C|nr:MULTISPECIES: ORF6N domain-containing protein [unclassified Pediococcus]KAF5440716.1 ORF6N domain-containing protein [Pediococcus sp. EKM202D]KAF5441721.1 ORF6N domain-containing protein [Pediococcus sp. EKM201D]